MLDGWSISPTGVESVLQCMVEPAENLNTAVTLMQTTLTALITATNSGAIGGAVNTYFESQGGATRLQAIGTRLQASTNGVVNATTAYANGDLEMATRTQREAAAAADGRALTPPRTGGSGRIPLPF